MHLLVPAFGAEESALPKTFAGAPAHWVTDSRRDFARRFVYPAVSKVVDRNGYSDALQEQILLRELRNVRRAFPYDVVISTSEPFSSAVATLHIDCEKKLLYIMDPPECIRGDAGTSFRNRKLEDVLKAQDAILTTPFIRKALSDCGYDEYDSKIVPVGFPMIEKHGAVRGRAENGKIHLLFCGWLYSDIRSPRYFLDIVSRLDERFSVTFMGKECERLRERFSFKTKAEVITLPQQPYQTALNAMQDADVLINIGNSVPVHMPSKTLEYINTGKPIVNFYKLPACPTLYYTERYPLCLNLFEGDTDMECVAQRLIRFCEDTKGETVRRDSIERTFADCTPQYIAQQILDRLGESND